MEKNETCDRKCRCRDFDSYLGGNKSSEAQNFVKSLWTNNKNNTTLDIGKQMERTQRTRTK